MLNCRRSLKLPSQRLSSRIEFYLKTFLVLPLHPGVAAIFGSIRAQLAKPAPRLGPNDLLIASR